MKKNEYTERLKNGEVIEITNEKEREVILNSFGILTDEQIQRRRKIAVFFVNVGIILSIIYYFCEFV